MSSSLKQYRKIKYLGKGSYGAAILVELRADPSQKFVIKEIVIGHLKPAEQQAAKNEAEVLYKMKHSNITTYIESFVESSKLYIVMEHADGGDLSAAVQKRKTDGKHWTEEEVMRIFVQICLALQHVHNQNILHRDLKSQNIFLTLNGMVKLGDFGIAKVLDASDDQARTQIGTPYYLSPEICESKPYGRASDVWSLGVILYELLALEMPFQASSLPALVHRIVSAEPSYAKLEGRYSAAMLQLCRELLAKTPEGRPSMGAVIRSDFIKSHISRLLSYTLRSGNGGVAQDPQQMPMPRDKVENKVEDKVEAARQQAKEAVRRAKEARRAMGAYELQQRPLSPKGRPLSPPPGNNPNPFRAPSGVQQQGQRALTPPGPRAQPRSLAEVQQQQGRAAGSRASPSPSAIAPMGAQGYAQGQGQGPSGGADNAARREYFANRAAAQAVKAKVEAQDRYERRRGDDTSSVVVPSRRPSDTPSVEEVDPEVRIANQRAAREREREREVAAKEAALKAAIEAQRDQRRMRPAAQQAIAFDIDLSPTPAAAPPVIHRHPQTQGQPQGQAAAAAPRSHSVPSSSSTPSVVLAEPAAGSAKRRGWGPPVDHSDILRAHRRGGADEEALGEGVDEGVGGEEVSAGVLRRLQAKRQSQMDMRNQAKEVLGRLREQRIKEHSLGGAAARKPMVSPAVRTSEGVREVSPMRQRLMAIMQHVAIAQESVAKAIACDPTAAAPPRRRRSNTSEEVVEKEDKGTGSRNRDDEVQEEVQEVGDELEDTLATWLQQQKRNVTTRAPRGRPQDRKEVETEVEDDPSLQLYCTSEDAPTRASAAIAKGVVDGEDVEIVDLQVHLAKALMGDDSSDEVPDEEEDHEEGKQQQRRR